MYRCVCVNVCVSIYLPIYLRQDTTLPDTLKACDAKRHKSCQRKYTTYKLSRVKKRSAPGPSNEVVSKFTSGCAPCLLSALAIPNDKALTLAKEAKF